MLNSIGTIVVLVILTNRNSESKTEVNLTPSPVVIDGGDGNVTIVVQF